MAEKVDITHFYARQDPQVEIEIGQNFRGYNWKIRYKGENSEEVLEKIKEVDLRLRAEYGNSKQSKGGNDNAQDTDKG